MRLPMHNILRVGLFVLIMSCGPQEIQEEFHETNQTMYSPPDTSQIPRGYYGDMIRYGRSLIVNTAYYIGPEGIVSQNLGNRMNCTNCHLDAGTRPFAYNYFSTHARYPQYRGRENKILSLSERVNNCIERPHNGTPLPLDSKEILAMTLYMKWVAKGVPVDERVYGDGLLDIEYPTRPADVQNGAHIYELHCSNCHGKNGEGLPNIDSSTYTYPPLWGANSYAKGSSTHRVLKAARFIKANMPDKKARWDKPFLSDHEAIDVAAYINDDRIHERPERRGAVSYPDINVKPVDYHEGPYPDTFSAYQHKFGPYKPIIDFHKEHNIPIVF